MTPETIQRENGQRTSKGTRGKYGIVGNRLIAW